MNMVVRGLENYKVMDQMYMHQYPKQYRTTRKAIQYKYFNKLLSYLTRIDVNKFENKFNDLSGIVGDFSLPSGNASKLYEITAQFPDGVELDEVTEVLIVLATKKRFGLLEKESAEEFYKRLDVLGRENWKMQKLGYSILKDE